MFPDILIRSIFLEPCIRLYYLCLHLTLENRDSRLSFIFMGIVKQKSSQKRSFFRTLPLLKCSINAVFMFKKIHKSNKKCNFCLKCTLFVLTLPLLSRLVPDEAFPEIFVLNFFLVISNFKSRSGGDTQKQYCNT